MARGSLRPNLNQIRTWVREGRTNAWIAHQLDVSPRDIDGFKREHGLAADEGSGEAGPAPPPTIDDDMRAEDDALVAAELDAMDEQAAEAAEEDTGDEAADADGDDEDGDDERRPRRRGRRGGRRRRGRRRPLEGTFDHGEEGYGLWLDPALQDDAVYAEHWAGHRPVTVAVEPDRIVIRRREDGESGSNGSGDSDDD